MIKAIGAPSAWRYHPDVVKGAEGAVMDGGGRAVWESAASHKVCHYKGRQTQDDSTGGKNAVEVVRSGFLKKC